MAAALKNWIHDDSMDQQFVDYWNGANQADRAKLLKDAGRDPFHKHKAWASVPTAVRIDVVTIMKRLQTPNSNAAKPRSIPNPNHWYNKED